MRRITTAAAALLVLVVGVRFAIQAGVFSAPYPSLGRDAAWALGVPEPAYNFGVVVPGRVYRSSVPDERFLAFVKREYGVERVIGLSGDAPVHRYARAIGMSVTRFDWPSRRLPDWDELQAVAKLLTEDAPVLIHCAAGADRTGFAVAVYRVLQMGWTLERAVSEMARYGHDPDEHSEHQHALADNLAAH